MKTFLIENATVVTPNEVIPNGSVLVEQGILTRIGQRSTESGASFRTIDAKGSYLMPGIIDIHTDALDMEIIPRPGADIPIPIAFRELERKMSGCGFTTVFHSMHLGYKVAELSSRSKYSRPEVFEKVYQAACGPTLLNNKIHLRFEVTGVDAYPICFELIEKGYISLLSIMDHTPGQGQFSMDRFMAASLKNGKTKAEALAEYEEKSGRPKIEGAQLEALIRHAQKHYIPVASHDDDSIEKVNFMHQLGVTICEFPITLETAHHATKLGMHVAGGASNILRGGSLSGNVCMKEAVKRGVIDTLCSDYYPPSILHSIFKLHREEGMSLPEAVNLASLNPAKAAQIQYHTGSIEVGKNADLLVVQLVDGIPMVTHTIVCGSIVSQASAKMQQEELCL